MLGSNNIKLCDLKVHLNTPKKCTSTEIPINLSFYVYIHCNTKRNKYNCFKLKKEKKKKIIG